MYFIARSMGLCASDLAQKYSFLTSPSGDAGPPFYVVIQAMWMCSRGGQIQNLHWGGVYMRKLAPARVSHWDDFLISSRVYMMTGSFHILLFNGTFHVDKIRVWFKIANITHAPPVPCASFRVFMIPLRDFVPEWNSRPGARTGVNSRRGDSRRHNILWWYHENKYRAMGGNRSELAPGRKSPRCRVNTPSVTVWHEIFARIFAGVFFWWIGDFLSFAETNSCD